MFARHSALHAASQNGHVEIVQALIKYGGDQIDINLKDPDGDAAVHHAALGDHKMIIQILKNAGADLNSRNRRNQTPLHIAVNKGHLEVLKALLELKCLASLQVNDH